MEFELWKKSWSNDLCPIECERWSNLKVLSYTRSATFRHRNSAIFAQAGPKHEYLFSCFSNAVRNLKIFGRRLENTEFLTFLSENYHVMLVFFFHNVNIDAIFD